jgi:hypothetical protein
LRPLNEGEKNLLQDLLRSAGWPPKKVAASERLLVTDMNDGGMGSIRFVKPGAEDQPRRMGARIAELEYSDEDGVTVLVSLNVDQEGELFELDIWKTNFGRLISYPSCRRGI